MLLVGRALQGLGFAGLQTITKVILSDKVSLKDTSFNNTLFTFLNGASFSIGPVIGGYLTRVRFLPFGLLLTSLTSVTVQLALVLHHQCAHRRPQSHNSLLPSP
jgi:MFS family permease